MIAGRRPFRGETAPAVIYQLLHDEPEPLARLRPDVTPELGALVGRLLAKAPADRPTAADLLGELREVYGFTSGTMPTRTASGPRRWTARRRGWIAALAAAVALAILLGIGYRVRRRRPGPVQITTFTRLTTQEGRESFPSLSPNGDFFVYAKVVDGLSRLLLQRVGSSHPVATLTKDLPYDARQPAYSPDGGRIAFRREGAEHDKGGIFLMEATGGSVNRLTDFGFDPAWSPDGKEIAVDTEGVSSPTVRTTRSRILLVDVATGRRRPLATGDGGDAVQPSWSPHRQRIAYWGLPPGAGRRIVSTVPTGGGKPVPVIDDIHLNWNPVWSPDGGTLYFISDRTGSLNLWRVAIDEKSGQRLGDPELVTTSSSPIGQLSLSGDGRRIAYAEDDGRDNVERVPFDPVAERAGPAAALTQGTQMVRSVDPSPDGRSVVYDTSSPRESLFVLPAAGGEPRQLTDDTFRNRGPHWSPEGNIVFYSNRGGDYDGWQIHPDGRGPERLTQSGVTYPIWSPHSRRLACTLGSVGTVLIDLTKPLAERKPQPLPFAPGAAQPFVAYSWAPDETCLAGTLGDEPGIVLYSFAARRCKRLTDRGSFPAWLHDSRRILYLDEGVLYLLETLTGRTSRLLLPQRPSKLASARPSADDRFLYLVRSTNEGDICMLTLHE
jgi:eukaryotic-like serine/threonine-protein kinase